MGWLRCFDSAVSVSSVYGVDLTTLVTMEGHKVPTLVRETIQEIESRGEESLEVCQGYNCLDLWRVLCYIVTSFSSSFPLGLEVEGIYRMSGKKNDILRLKCKFDTGGCGHMHCLVWAGY